MTHKQIAEQEGVGHDWVDISLSRARRCLGAKTTGHALALAIKTNIISVPTGANMECFSITDL
jgi:hypothetical protein